MEKGLISASVYEAQQRQILNLPERGTALKHDTLRWVRALRLLDDLEKLTIVWEGCASSP